MIAALWRHKNTPGTLTLDPSAITGVTVDETFTATARLRNKKAWTVASPEFTLTWAPASQVFEYTPTLAESTDILPGDYVVTFRLEKLPNLRYETEVDLRVERSRY